MRFNLKQIYFIIKKINNECIEKIKFLCIILIIQVYVRYNQLDFDLFQKII